ncbi:MAG: Nif3-like dinuclear metal center hexameric protein [Phycisphaerae bacterium]|nr:Nif3-like dinuclear metal center hexameric protein [Phycisphaerae bacterium]
MKIDRIAAEIEKIAPLKLAQDWDNVGFLIGDPDREIDRILVTIDITRDVVAEAKAYKADLIVSYHPAIWDGLKKITAAGPSGVIYNLIRAGIGVYSIHTSLDVAAGGVNDALADILGLVECGPIGDYVDDPAGPLYKLITFVPAPDVDKVAEAVHAAGAGQVGNYAKCAFRTEGTGTFLPLEGASPAIGRQGKFEKVEEVRLETVVAAAKVTAVVAALRKAHPYETPAFDVVRHWDVEKTFGLGRIGRLAEPRRVDDLLARIKEVTGAAAAGIIGDQKRTVKTAAVCAGSCGKLISNVIDRQCDLYLTGELKHHQALMAQEAGLTCICLSHTVSERFALKNLAKQLKKGLSGVTIKQSTKDRDPFVWKTI